MMNKEKLEQMKKEKLEQMKELGRGGISRGLSLLQKANTAMYTNVNTTSTDEGEDGGAEAASTAGGATAKPSYDDLVSLSMKLTRQNKLMKAQFQKMQARIAELQTRDADCSVLATFVSDVVGVDLLACQLPSGAASSSDESEPPTIDAKQLKQRYEIMQALKLKALTAAGSKATSPPHSSNGSASVSLLPLSPPSAASLPQYAEIDLLGDAFSLPPAPRQLQAHDAFTADFMSLELSSNSISAPSATSLDVLEKQLAETKSQLQRLEAEREQWRRQLEDANQQHRSSNEAFAKDRQELQRQIDTAKAAKNITEQRVHVLQAKVEQLEVQLKSADTSSGDVAAVQTELKQAKATIEALQAAAQDAAAASASALAVLEAEKASLLAKLNEQGRNGASQQALPESNGSIDAMMEEMERVKLARAEADHLVKGMQEKLALSEKKLAKALTEVEQNGAVIDALRSEIARLMDDIKRLEDERKQASATIAGLQAEKARLDDTKDELSEQLQVLRANNSSNLESVVGELAEAKKQVAEQREYMNGKIEALIKELDAARKQSESLEATLADKEKQSSKIASSQSTLTTELMTLQKQVATMEEDLQMAAAALEAQETKVQESELRRKELEEKLENARLQSEMLKDQHLNDLEVLRSGKESELERTRTEKNGLQKKLNESIAAYDAVSLRCSGLQDDLDHEKKRAAGLESRLSQLTAEVGNMSIDLAETKKALSDRMALATRLQTENMGFAETQAEQAARVESALRDAATAKQQVAAMEAKVQDAQALVSRFQRERDDASNEMQRLKQQLEDEKSSMRQQLEAKDVSYKGAIASEKEAFRRELERVESDSKQKSKLALHAVLVKESEIERLSKRLAELEEDVRSGDADNRKIFEVAQMQANREMEARANAAKIHELTRKLELANSKVDELVLAQSRHSEEITAMMQTQRREGVNMEYLKNVIVQFMTFKPGSSQQLRLIPVITTLLQFSAADMKEVKKANSRRTSWTTWGAVEKTESYKPIAGVAAPGSTTAPTATTPTRRRTSPPTTSEFHRLDEAALAADSFPAGSSSRVSSYTLPPHDGSGDAARMGSSAQSSTESADF